MRQTVIAQSLAAEPARQRPDAPVLRKYQMTLVDEIRAALRRGYRCPLVVASTGAGKTITFAYITHGAAEKNTPVLVCAHRKEIIRQISLSLAKFGIYHQVIAPKEVVAGIVAAHWLAFRHSYVSRDATTMVGSVQTIVGRFDVIDRAINLAGQRQGKPARLMIVMDEGHHCVQGTQHGQIMDRYPSAVGLIFTASPERLDGTGLGVGHGGYADILIEGPPMSWLIENGYLSQYRVFGAANPIDMTGAEKRGGDWTTAAKEERANRPSITGDAIEHYLKYANGLRAVVFCASVKHSKAVAEAFNAAGIPAAHIDGEIKDEVRDQAIMDFAAGRILVLTQVNLVSEGFDLASIAQTDVTIDCLIDLSPTESLVNAMQRWGRALRPALGKIAIILDHAGNVGRVVGGVFKTKHGLPDAPRKWSLEGRKKKKRGEQDDEEAPVTLRTCGECFAIVSPGDEVAAGRAKASRAGHEYTGPCCPVCDADFPVRSRGIAEVDGQLEDISALARKAAEADKLAARRAQGQARTVDELVEKLNYSSEHAAHIVKARKEKEELIKTVKAELAAWQKETKGSVKNTFGVFSSDVDKMKPKALKELLANIANDNASRSG